MPDERTGRPNIGHATGRGVVPDERIGRPNIGHATGRGVVPDERINNGALSSRESGSTAAGNFGRSTEHECK
ncbi:hypothetical protein [Evansella tamaricis]|uniref:Uncharacterized protein n=1 Tax=Evansella tamaricis TaxID=2069301 RepID=A0ABS6JH91_9BACI|nr:hypothetical protein [Evansella tamaricis]MBU9712222.1 hypothetical protein [Evansella tamaricis]